MSRFNSLTHSAPLVFGILLVGLAWICPGRQSVPQGVAGRAAVTSSSTSGQGATPKRCRFRRIVVGFDSLTFEGRKTTWEALPGLFKEIASQPNAWVILTFTRDVLVSDTDRAGKLIKETKERIKRLCHKFGVKDHGAGGYGYDEGRFELDKDIPVSLVVGIDQPIRVHTIRLESFHGDTDHGDTRGFIPKISGLVFTRPTSCWMFTLTWIDEQGKALGRTEYILDIHGFGGSAPTGDPLPLMSGFSPVEFNALPGSRLPARFTLLIQGLESAQPSDIKGVVRDATPDVSAERWAPLERAVTQMSDGSKDSSRKVEEIFRSILVQDPRPLAGAVVTLQSSSLTSETLTDAQGRYHVGCLPEGVYHVSSRMALRPPSGVGPERMESVMKEIRIDHWGRKTFNQDRGWGNPDLEFHAEAITLRGRVTDVQGRPIAGAKVRGVPYPMPQVEEITPPTRYAVSGADGTYEMRGFIPKHIYKLAGYLGGGDPTEGGQYAFYIDVYAESAGYVQARNRVPRLPPISEEMRDAARRLGKILGQWAARMGSKERWDEKEDLNLPASQGNTITGIDIVLEKAPPQ